MASMAQSPVSFTANLASKSTTSDLLRSSANGVFGVTLRALGRAHLGAKRREYTVSTMIRKGKKREYPWARDPDLNVKGGVLRHLSTFKPLKEKPKPVILDFEKPLMDIQTKIVDVKKLANETGLDFSDHIVSLESKYNKALKDLYTHLTPIQRLHIARHPHRPTFLDHVFNITEKFIELHGDRTGYDDPAIVTGLGSINGRTYMFIGHQKGRNTIENIQRNFGMPTPHGYRKALRMMHYADHHGFPIITFIDTPGAFADLNCEEVGQGEAVAQNMKTMLGLKVPIVSIVIGEGGSGGALASACANKLLMLENAVFYVASPEACAAILWKNAKTAPKAAKKLRITARALFRLQICDAVLPEPLGGAHADPDWTSQRLKTAIVESMDELMKMDAETLSKHRAEKFRKIGRYRDPVHPESKKKDVHIVPELGGSQTGVPIDPKRKFRMKKNDHVVLIRKTWKVKLRDEVEKLEKQFFKASNSSAGPPQTGLEKMIKKLKRGIDNEFVKAAKAVGVETNILMVRKKIAKAGNASDIEQLKYEFDKQLPQAPNYSTIKYMLDMLKKLSNTLKLPRKSTRKGESRTEINNSSDLKDIVELLKAEVAEAGKTPEEDSKLKMLALEIEINQAIEDAVNLPELEEKDEKLVAETLVAS